MPAAVPAIRLRDVSVWRWHTATGTRVTLLAGIDLDVLPGERWALLGPNGAGKTTLLSVLGAVDFPSAGSVELLGRRLGRTDVRRLRAEIGHVDARTGHRFAPALSVEEVVRTGGTGTITYFERRLTQGDIFRADDLVALLGLGPIARRRFADCSHGERKRALIARALMPRPRLLLLDEPGAGLDLPGRETLLRALDGLAAEEPELAVVMTTHHVEELPATTGHALLLRAGVAVGQGLIRKTLTDARLTECFGMPISVSDDRGRWHAVAAATGLSHDVARDTRRA